MQGSENDQKINGNKVRRRILERRKRKRRFGGKGGK